MIIGHYGRQRRVILGVESQKKMFDADDHRFPRNPWSRSIASNSALKFPTPKPCRIRWFLIFLESVDLYSHYDCCAELFQEIMLACLPPVLRRFVANTRCHRSQSRYEVSESVYKVMHSNFSE
jgi:hypothetical protein